MERIWSRIKKLKSPGIAFGTTLALFPALVGSTAIFGAAAMAAPLSQPAPFATHAIQLETPLRIVAFGSSSTQGFGATNPAATYPAQLQGLLSGMLPKGRKVQVINRGIGGEDADDMARRLQADVIDRHPDVVIWQTGSNDPVRHVPLERFDRETREGVAQMRAAGIQVILMEPQWCPKLDMITTTKDYRDAVRRVGRDMDVAVIRRSDLMHDWIREGMLTPKEMLAADGMHMTDGGYALLARSAARQVMKLEDIHTPTQTSAAMP